MDCILWVKKLNMINKYFWTYRWIIAGGLLNLPESYYKMKAELKIADSFNYCHINQLHDSGAEYPKGIV